MAVKALLIAVSDYSKTNSLCDLPFCQNDLTVMKSALEFGIDVKANHIDSLGKNGTVTKSDFLDTLEYKSYDLTDEDTFIFYFSGHGGKVNNENCLLFSDDNYSLQNLINEIDKISAKAKVIFLDCCHSGNFILNKEIEFDINEDIDRFAGTGIAILASCGANETSGFDDAKPISLFTRFLSDALNNKFINRQGKKSLEAVAELVRRYSDVWNSRNHQLIQHPVYRSAIGGTIFFQAENYQPYQVANYYEECEKYIIYTVKPLHSSIAKRYSANVILKYPFTLEEISHIAKEIKNKLINCEIFQNQKAEKNYLGKPANIIWCYFGYDEDDMVDSNYFCHTTWVDDFQDKSWWYRKSKHSTFVNDVFFEIHIRYEAIKSLKNKSIDINDFIKQSRECTLNIITYGEKYIGIFREYLNGMLNEEQFINVSQHYIAEIDKWYSKEMSLDIPPNDLHDWSLVQMELAGSLHDCALYYNKKFLDKWEADNRKWLMNNSIKRYQTDLERYKSLDIEVSHKY